jgi:Flp pilus assembly protein TadG
VIQRRRRATERGQALIVLALTGLTMFGFGAIALDQGIGMSDRRDLQSIVDSASLAGARSSASGTGTEHWVTMEYLARSLNFSVSAVSSQGCTSSSACSAGTYTVGDYTFNITDSGKGLDVSAQHSRRTLIAGVLGFNTAVAGTAARAQPTGPSVTPANYAMVGLGGDVQVNGGGVTGDPSGNVGGAAYAYGNFGSNNGPHAVQLPGDLTDGATSTSCTPAIATHVDLGGATDGDHYTINGGGTQNTDVTKPAGFGGMAPTTTGPAFASGSAAAKDSQGNWKPGTYDGWYPTGTSGRNGAGANLDPGVYVIKNVSTGIDLHDLQNLTPATPAPGVVDSAGAVAFVVDSSDNGSALSFTNSSLNGLDDLTGTGTNPDPQGTHNFVVYGAGFTGSSDIGNSTLSGIVYLPDSNGRSNGNTGYTVYGSAWFNSYTLNGGGNGVQQFKWVCGLDAVVVNTGGSGLVR